MARLTRHPCHSHRSEHPCGLGGNSNFLEEGRRQTAQELFQPHYRGEEETDEETEQGDAEEGGYLLFNAKQ